MAANGADKCGHWAGLGTAGLTPAVETQETPRSLGWHVDGFCPKVEELQNSLLGAQLIETVPRSDYPRAGTPF